MLLLLFSVANSLPLRWEGLNGPSFNLVPALVAKLLTMWVRISELKLASIGLS